MAIRNTFDDFFLPSNLSNNDIIFALRPGLKTGMNFRGRIPKSTSPRVSSRHFGPCAYKAEKKLKMAGTMTNMRFLPFCSP